MKDLSLIIAVWNQEKYIEQAIISAFQNKCDIEIIILDDGSTDRTLEIIEKIKIPDNIELKLIKQTHTGNMGANLKKAYEYVSTKYVVEIGSDDYLLPNALDELYDFIEKHPDSGLAYSGYYADREGKISGPIPHPNNKYYHWTNNPELRLLENNFVTPPCIMRKSVYDQVLYDSTQIINEDYLIKLELSRITKFSQLQKPLAVLRIRRDSISNNPDNRVLMSHWEQQAREKVKHRHGW